MGAQHQQLVDSGVAVLRPAAGTAVAARDLHDTAGVDPGWQQQGGGAVLTGAGAAAGVALHAGAGAAGVLMILLVALAQGLRMHLAVVGRMACPMVQDLVDGPDVRREDCCCHLHRRKSNLSESSSQADQCLKPAV